MALMKLTAGLLDRSIQILSKSGARDAAGQPLDDWTAGPIIHAAWYPLRDAEVIAQAGRQDQARSKFLIRWRAGITAKQRIVWDGTTFEITGTQEEGRHIGLWLLVREIV